MSELPSVPLRQAQNVLYSALRHCGRIAGAYLHGSHCLGGSVPGRSDLDLLIVTEASMARAERIAFADELLPLHG